VHFESFGDLVAVEMKTKTAGGSALFNQWALVQFVREGDARRALMGSMHFLVDRQFVKVQMSKTDITPPLSTQNAVILSEDTSNDSVKVSLSPPEHPLNARPTLTRKLNLHKASPDETYTLLCTSLPVSITESQLRAHFEGFGCVSALQLTLVDHSASSTPREPVNSARVQFMSTTNAMMCLSATLHVIDGYKLKLVRSHFDLHAPLDVVAPSVDATDRNRTSESTNVAKKMRVESPPIPAPPPNQVTGSDLQTCDEAYVTAVHKVADKFVLSAMQSIDKKHAPYAMERAVHQNIHNPSFRLPRALRGERNERLVQRVMQVVEADERLERRGDMFWRRE
jgi:hypothetical protein